MSIQYAKGIYNEEQRENMKEIISGLAYNSSRLKTWFQVGLSVHE